jgi:hypothetical protein
MIIFFAYQAPMITSASRLMSVPRVRKDARRGVTTGRLTGSARGKEPA